MVTVSPTPNTEASSSSVEPPAGSDNIPTQDVTTAPSEPNPALSADGALDVVLTEQQLRDRRFIPGFGGKAACQKQRDLRSLCISQGIFDIDLTNDNWQWPNVLKSLPTDVQEQIVRSGIARFSFRLLQGELDPNYRWVDSGESHVFEVVRVDGSRCHLHFHKNGRMDPLRQFPSPGMIRTTDSGVSPPIVLPVYYATDIFGSAMETHPIGRNEAHLACQQLLSGMSAGTRIDITNEISFHWKRFLRTELRGREIVGKGIYTVYVIDFNDKPALAFRCVGGVTRIIIPSNKGCVPQLKKMPTNKFKEDYPTVSTTSSSWMRQAPPCEVPLSLQLLEQGRPTAAEGEVYSNYMERGMQLEQDLKEAKQSFDEAQASRAFGSDGSHLNEHCNR